MSLPSIPETFAQTAREIFWPRTRSWLVLHAAALLLGLDYWLSTFWFEPHLPLDLAALYRPEGDTQYVALVANLARGQLGESALYESFGTGLQAFPLGTMALHVLSVALLGTAGFLVADALSGLFYYWSVSLLLANFGLPPAYARIISLCTAGGATVEWVNWLIKKSLLPPMQLVFWGGRLPRPIVSEIPLVLTIALCAALVRFPDARGSRWVWAAWGASLAWLVQGDIHGAAGLGLFSGPVLLVAALQLKKWRAAGLRLGIALGALLICLLPFFAQNLTTDFEVTRRWGAFPLPRFNPPSQLEENWPRVLQALGIVGACFVVRLMFERTLRARFPRPPEAPGAVGQALLLVGLALAAWLMMPAFVMVTGKGLQLYHFPDRLVRILSYTILVALGLSAHALITTLLACVRPFIRPKKPELFALAVGLACTCVTLRAQFTVHTISYGPPRGGFPGTGAYKDDFTELTRRLLTNEFAEAKVLGTFDHATMLWWVGFKPGFVLTPDPFLTSRPDAELEERFVALAKEVQISDHKFAEIAKNTTSHIFYISCAKYNASPLYRLSEERDYTKEQLSQIQAANLLSGFNLQIPRSAVQRLKTLYGGPREHWDRYKKPDVIVVNRHDRTYGYAPAQDRYELILQNSTFELWKRRTTSNDR